MLEEKAHPRTANFLEILLNDEEATLQQLNRLCGDENVFSYTRVPRRRMPVEVTPARVVPQAEIAEDGGAVNRENSIRSKILAHFVKGKVSLTPMETIMMIPGELEQLENLVKVARRKRDAETEVKQVSLVSASPNLRRICVNKTHMSKTLHLSVEINGYLIEGLVDTGASMSVMAAAVVREMGMMHLVSGSETYKTASGMLMQAMGRIDEVSVKTGGVQCAMTFMIVDTDSYDVLLGFDFLIKIGTIVDVERGLIQVRHGPGSDVEVLPLTVVNMLQASNFERKSRNYGEVEVVAEQQHTDDRVQEQRMAVQTSDSNSDTSEGSEDECQVFKSDCAETEFKDTKLEQLIQ